MDFHNHDIELVQDIPHNQQIKPPQIPQLSTRETARLREDYPSIEHLEANNIASWLIERQDQLLVRAKYERAGMNLSKLITLSATAIGTICYATSPLAPIGAAIAGIGYLWAVAEDLNNSHFFAPIPFIRGNFLEFLSAMGDSQAREQWFSSKDEVADLMFHLEPFERYEFVMLRQFSNTLTDFLTIIEPGKRFYAYRYLLDSFVNYRGVFPTTEQLSNHLAKVTPDPRINVQLLQAIQEHQQQQYQLPQPKFGIPESAKFMELPQPKFMKLPTPGSPTSTAKPPANIQPPNLQALLSLPLSERAYALIDALNQSGFDIAKCILDQITIICGNQRGGKGTLMAILAILSKALEPQTKIHYFTGGDDIYPFQCSSLLCRLNYPNLDGSDADARVASELYNYLKKMDDASIGSYQDIILVIDEAVALSGYLDDDQKQWMIRFLLTRASKKGAQIFIVLHGKNLTSWVGTKNTAGFGDTFKTGATFVGCEATSKKLSPLKSISVATGRYFLAEPDSFDSAVKDGEIGMIPDWLKTETNPATGQPDPARTLIKFFPELADNNSTVDDSSSVQDNHNATVSQQEEFPNPEPTDTDIEQEKTTELTEPTEPTNKQSFDELLNAIIKSFTGKEATPIKRIPSGCNRVRTALTEFDKQRSSDILVYLIERLVQQGKVRIVGDEQAEKKVKQGKPTLTPDHEFVIV